MRTEESFASYLEGKASDTAPVIGPVTEELLKRKLDVQMVISTRYGRQAPVLRQRCGNRVRVIDHVVDATSLLYYSTIFVFFSSRRRHTRFDCDWSSDVCSSD